jgi:hypothetical protein
MHPNLIGQLAQQRTDEMRQDAAADARGEAAARPARASIRNRAGWTLVHIGLRLAAH